MESNSKPGLTAKDILLHREKLKRPKYPFLGTVNLLVKQEVLKTETENKFTNRLLEYQLVEAATFWFFYYFQTLARISETTLIDMCDVFINRKEIFTIDTHKHIDSKVLEAVVLTVRWFNLTELSLTQKQFIIQALGIHAQEILSNIKRNKELK